MRFAGLLLVSGAIALCAGVLVTRVFKLSANPEPELIGILAATEKDGLSEPVPGTSPGTSWMLVSQKHHFDRATVQMSEDGLHATAIATLDFTGKVGDIPVSSLGLERVRFQRTSEGWKLDGPPAPVLGAVVRALELRREALLHKDVKALAALLLDARGKIPLEQERGLTEMLAMRDLQLDIKGWFIRSERDAVLVTEEYRLQGDTPDRPVDEEGRRRLVLIREGGRLLFDGALM